MQRDFQMRFATCSVSMMLAGVLGVGAPIVFAQSSPARSAASQVPAVKMPEFDVTSVKPSKANGPGSGLQFTPDGFRATDMPLRILIREAYGVNDEQIVDAPRWVDSENFDIDAKVAGTDVTAVKNLTVDQRLMIQPFLADRFKLIVHHATRNLPVYALVIAKGGSKLQEVKADAIAPDGRKSGGSWQAAGRGQLNGKAITMESFLPVLSQQLGRTAIDRTGLMGNYDLTLQWTPDESGGSASNSSGPSIFTALQEQLGLKLEPSKGPVDVIVIDHVEKPSEN
jgi:uncharacterized protein (TIGR03435 family)